MEPDTECAHREFLPGPYDSLGYRRRSREKAARDLLVVRPHTSRNVSAILASGGKAGWQHVKISRSRSSSTSFRPSSRDHLGQGRVAAHFPSEWHQHRGRRRRMPFRALQSAMMHDGRPGWRQQSTINRPCIGRQCHPSSA